jgi:hypothetical protein
LQKNPGAEYLMLGQCKQRKSKLMNKNKEEGERKCSNKKKVIQYLRRKKEGRERENETN